MSQAMSQAMSDALLRVENLRVRFDRGGQRVHAVNGLTYQLRAGRTLAIIGESGSGKTVSSRALMGLLPSTATVTGSARIDGVELVGMPEHEMRSRFGDTERTYRKTFERMYT